MRTRKELQNPTQANHLLAIAAQVYKTNPMIDSRERSKVFARAAISVQLLSAGERREDIGAFLNRDYATILHSEKAHPDRLQYDREYKELYFKFLAQIGKPDYQKELTQDEVRFQVKRLTKELLNLNFSYDDVMKFWFQTINECKTHQS
jgi:hypothetical protein